MSPRDEQILTLWREQKTSSVIAAGVGCTRAAVMGVVTRAVAKGIVKPRSATPPSAKTREAPKAAPVAAPAPAPVAAPAPAPKLASPARPMAKPAPLAPIEPRDPFARFGPVASAVARLNDCVCRFPVGDPREDGFRFCCVQVRLGARYCADHAQIAFTSRERLLVPTSRSGALHGRAA